MTSTPDPTPVLIGFGGLLGSGKDAVADHLVDHHGYVKHFMSDALAKALYVLNPWIPVARRGRLGKLADRVIGVQYQRYQNVVDKVGYTIAKTNPEVRRLLQVLGTEVGREMIDPNVWTNIIRRGIVSDLAAGRSVVLTGVRFSNERDLISDLGGTLVWVHRPENPFTPPETAGTGQHASESTLGADDFDVVVVNDGTLDDLALRADKLAEELRS